MEKDLKIIKKKYGEKFAHYCRSNFPTLLEKEGTLSGIIEKILAPTHSIYEDLHEHHLLDDFKVFIYNKARQKEHKVVDDIESPEVLMDRAGYVLYKCETDEDVKSFKKYYKEDEQLCTFRDPHRIDDNTIFFAVKKDVDKIKREDFETPRRQDEYGTSVISLQFTKGEGSLLSIKNRYNHTVINPDATFSNDLENIIAGLTDSFEKYYGIKQKLGRQKFEIPNYVRALDGKFYRYNYENNNRYYCENNIVIDMFEPKSYDKSRYEVIGYYILDKQTKELISTEKDSFVDLFQDVKTIDITNLDDKKGRKFIITNNDETSFEFEVNEHNDITTFHAPELKVAGDNMLNWCKSLIVFDAPKLESMGARCLSYCSSLIEFNVPKLQSIKEGVLYNCHSLKRFYVPELKHIECDCLMSCGSLEEIYAPKLETISAGSFLNCSRLEIINAEKLKKIGHHSFKDCFNLIEINMPELEEIGQQCFYEGCKSLVEFNAPKLTKIGAYCLQDCISLVYLNVPKLTFLGECCFVGNKKAYNKAKNIVEQNYAMEK